MDFGTLAPWAQGGAFGILTFVALLVFLGKLVPSATVDRLIKPYTERVASLEKANELEVQRGAVRDQQFDRLVEGMKTTNELISALSRAAERNGQ